MKTINQLVRINKVYESNNYDLISIYKSNRFTGQNAEVIEGQEKDFKLRLKKTKKLLKNGFNKHLPILCGYLNGVLTSYEGNTRIVACREMGINFFYEVDETLTDEEEFEFICFLLNNTGTPWNSKEKIVHIVSAVKSTPEQRENAKKIIDLTNKYGITLSTVLYVASNGCGHKTEMLAKKSFKIHSDTEEILSIAKKMAENNINHGLSLLKSDKFVRTVMTAIRKTNANNREIIISNLINHSQKIKLCPKKKALDWNYEIQTIANYNLKASKNKIILCE